MDYKRAMYFLSALYSDDSITEDQRSELRRTFFDVFRKSDNYLQMKKLMESSVFTGEKGEEISKRAKQAIDKVGPDFDLLDNLKELTDLRIQLEEEIHAVRTALLSPVLSKNDFYVIDQDDIKKYETFYRFLASVICYYMLCEFGEEAIKNLYYNRKGGFLDILGQVNYSYYNELLNNAKTSKAPSWIISKVSFYNDNLIIYDGYRIEYNSLPCKDLLAAHGEIMNYRQIAPYMYAAEDFQQPVHYIGEGNLIGVEPGRALSLLEGEIITSLSANAFGHDDLNLSEPLNELARVLHTKSYCISPNDFAAALDRWSLSYTLEQREKNNQCIICGETLYEKGMHACNSHFSLNQ